MTISLLFWVIMLILLIFGALPFFGTDKPGWRTGGPTFVVWVLLALIGWKVFGPAIHG